MSACHNADRCVAYDRTTKTTPWVDRTPLCDDCLTITARDIARLPADHQDLYAHLWPDQLGQHLDGQPIGSGEQPMPLAGHVDALQRDIVHTVTTWDEILRDRLGLADRTGYTAWAGLRAACDILTAHVRRLALLGPVAVNGPTLHHPPVELTGLDAIDALRWLHRRALAVTGITTDTRTMPGYCPNPRCGRPALRHDNGKNDVYCAHCGHLQTLDDYDRYGNAFLRGAA
jgi:hypothetical protein